VELLTGWLSSTCKYMWMFNKGLTMMVRNTIRTSGKDSQCLNGSVSTVRLIRTTN